MTFKSGKGQDANDGSDSDLPLSRVVELRELLKLGDSGNNRWVFLFPGGPYML